MLGSSGIGTGLVERSPPPQAQTLAEEDRTYAGLNANRWLRNAEPAARGEAKEKRRNQVDGTTAVA
jgi:hypothetical protein